MRIGLYTPWENRWKGSLQKAFKKAGHEAMWNVDANGCDVLFCMWANKDTAYFSQKTDTKLFTYIRSFEIYDSQVITGIKWSRISGIFYCSGHVQELAMERLGKQIKDIPQYVIHNWVDTSEFPLKTTDRNTDIAMVCSLDMKKNMPLAVQALYALPETYKLHIVGQCHDPMTWDYMRNTDLGDRLCYYGPIHPNQVHQFLSNKTYIISSSFKEGCPMNILEGMSMGLKPLIHSWPGSRDIFPSAWIWTKTKDIPIMLTKVEPQEYRDYVETHFSLSNADKIVEIVTS